MAGGTVLKDPLANAGDMGLIPESGNPVEDEMASHSSILARKFHGQRSLEGYSPWGHKEPDITELTHTCCLQPTTLSHWGNFTKMVLSYYYKALSRQKLPGAHFPGIQNSKCKNL